MSIEGFQPISVKPPSRSPILFWIRCRIDLQLGSIVKYLRPAMSDLHGRILDLGAGESPWRDWMPEGCLYQGIDVENSQEYGMNIERQEIIYYDGKIIPFPKSSFDGAICIEVLEHVENPDEFVSEISRVLKKGSILLLTVPWSARRHHIPHDYHRFTRERLARLFEENGFDNVDIRERGTEIGTIASKLVVLTIRLLKPKRTANMFWTVPIAVIFAPAVAALLAAAHISDAIGRGSREDPLGYFVRAVCSAS